MVDLIGVDAVVGNGADATVISAGDQHPMCLRSRDQRLHRSWSPSGSTKTEEQYVGLDSFGFYKDAGQLGEPFSQPQGIGMI
jgi:hypothetical protein